MDAFRWGPSEASADLRIGEALAAATTSLRGGVEGLDAGEARLEAEVLLGHALGVDRARLYAGLSAPLLDGTQRDYRALVARRLDGEPVAYITGVRDFYGLTFHVDRRVLIPRPETELLVDAAIDLVSPAPGTRPGVSSLRVRSPGLSAPRPAKMGGQLTVADVGCGSGCVAVSLAFHVPGATVYATDISSDALEVTQLNAQRHGVAEWVTPLQGDLLTPLPGPVDLIVANLPYVRHAELAALPLRITAYEPRLALEGGADGLVLIRRLLHQVAKAGRDGPAGVHYGRPTIILEIGHDQATEVLRLVAQLLSGARASVHPDLAGHDRMVALWWT